MEQILISKDNAIAILKGLVNDIQTKINNKDLSTPYIEQFTKAGIIKTDGNGDMFLCNNGEYVKIDLNQISITQEMINTIYDLFKIEYQNEYWTTGLSMPTTRYGLTSEIYNGKIYCIGGNDVYIFLNNVEIYDINNNTWCNNNNPMPTARYGLTSQIYNGKIYCIGGNNTSTDKIDIYDIKNDTWSNGTPLNTKRHHLTSQIYNGKIYCIGGTVNNIIDIYDIKTNTWSTAYTFIQQNYLTSQTYNGKIYCIGGSVNNVYDILNNTWNTINPIPNNRYAMTSQIYDDKIYCIGGNDNSSITDIVEVYNISTNTWSIKKPIPTQRSNLTSQIYNRKIYCIGGFNKECLNNNDILTLPYSNYEIKLPDELDNKLNIIKSDGLGNKLLADNGTYIDPSSKYTVIQDNEISDLINQICAKEV